MSFLQSIARQIAIGYQYTRLYTDKEREAKRSARCCRLRMRLNARSDFREVSSLVLNVRSRLWALIIPRWACSIRRGSRISLAAFKAAPHAAIDSVQGLFDAHGKSLDMTAFPGDGRGVGPGQDAAPARN